MLSIKNISRTHTHTFSPLHSQAFSLCCEQNVNVFQALRYISAISGTVLSTTMVCREQWSRDQCSISWISEADILCKFISHCEQASQLVNGTVCTTALFTRSLQSTRLSPCILSPVSPPSPRSLRQLSSQPTVALIAIKDAHRLICVCARRSRYTQEQTPTHNKISDPLAFGAITVHCLPTPSLIFILLYHHITLILLYVLHTRLPTKPPDPLILRWVNCSSCPWPL